MLKTEILNSNLQDQITMMTSQKTSVPLGAYEIEKLNNENERNINEEGQFTEANYPFTIKPNFSLLGSIIAFSTNITGSQIAFIPDDIIRDLLWFKQVIIHEEYNVSVYPVDKLYFVKLFPETDIAQRMIFKWKWSGVISKFTKDVDFGFEIVNKFQGEVQW